MGDEASILGLFQDLRALAKETGEKRLDHRRDSFGVQFDLHVPLERCTVTHSCHVIRAYRNIFGLALGLECRNLLQLRADYRCACVASKATIAAKGTNLARQLTTRLAEDKRCARHDVICTARLLGGRTHEMTFW